MDIKRKVDIVRQDFEDDVYNHLVCFLHPENYPDCLEEDEVVVVYRTCTGDFACELLDDMVDYILEEKMEKVRDLAECGPVELVTTGGIYIVTPPKHLPPDEDGWKLLSPEGEESYYFTLKELWGEIQPEEILEIR